MHFKHLVRGAGEVSSHSNNFTVMVSSSNYLTHCSPCRLPCTTSLEIPLTLVERWNAPALPFALHNVLPCKCHNGHWQCYDKNRVLVGTPGRKKNHAESYQEASRPWRAEIWEEVLPIFRAGCNSVNYNELGLIWLYYMMKRCSGWRPLCSLWVVTLNPW